MYVISEQEQSWTTANIVTISNNVFNESQNMDYCQYGEGLLRGEFRKAICNVLKYITIYYISYPCKYPAYYNVFIITRIVNIEWKYQ